MGNFLIDFFRVTVAFFVMQNRSDKRKHDHVCILFFIQVIKISIRLLRNSKKKLHQTKTNKRTNQNMIPTHIKAETFFFKLIQILLGFDLCSNWNPSLILSLINLQSLRPLVTWQSMSSHNMQISHCLWFAKAISQYIQVCNYVFDRLISGSCFTTVINSHEEVNASVCETLQ